MAKQKSKAELSQFRAKLRVLKKQGLIDPAIEVRKQEPTAKLERAIKRYADVVAGRATAIEMTPQKTREFQQAEYDIARPQFSRTIKSKSGKRTITRQGPARVIIPHDVNEKVIASGGRGTGKATKVSIKHPAGITRTPIPIPTEFESVTEYLEFLEENSSKIDATLPPNSYFGFKLYGWNSHELYSSIGKLIDQLASYGTLDHAMSSGKARDNQSILHHLEILTVERGKWSQQRSRKRKARTKKQGGTSKIDRLKRGPTANLTAFRKKHAEQERARRARIKATDPAKYQRIQQHNQERARKSERKRKRR
jgi:hypothetical protein